MSVVTDHEYVPCFYEGKNVKYIKGFCENPSGPDTCHLPNCGLRKEQHDRHRKDQETNKTSKQKSKRA